MRHEPLDADTISEYVAKERQMAAEDFLSEMQDEYGDVNLTMEAQRCMENMSDVEMATRGCIVRFPGDASNQRVVIGEWLISRTSANN